MSTLHAPWLVPLVAAGPMTLATLRPGSFARVLRVDEPGSAGERLMEMGLTPGTWVKVVRRGFMGGPLVLEIRGYLLSVRAQQASRVAVVPASP